MKEMFTRLQTLTSLFLLCFSCEQSTPCTSLDLCPALAGTYLMSWENPFNNTCSQTGPRPLSLTFTQAISSGGTTINGVNLGGSIFETNEFTMAGGNLNERYNLRGTVVSASAKSDAGTRIVGSLNTTLQNADGGSGCTLREDYVGDKVSR